MNTWTTSETDEALPKRHSQQDQSRSSRQSRVRAPFQQDFRHHLIVGGSRVCQFDTADPIAIIVLDQARGSVEVWRLQISLADFGDLDYQVGSGGVVGPSFDASAFTEKVVADDRPAVFPRLRPALEVSSPGFGGELVSWFSGVR
jgi:hypothetical protein